MPDFFLPYFPQQAADGHTWYGECAYLLTAGYGGGISGDPVVINDGSASLIKWSEPLSAADGKAGGICQRSGRWFPGHQLVHVDGRQMGLPFVRKEPKRRSR
jgi:hypothetical protein